MAWCLLLVAAFGSWPKAVGEQGFPSRGCPEALGELGRPLPSPGEVRTLQGVDHEGLAFEIEWDPIVTLKPFPRHLVKNSQQTKYLAVTQRGRLLIVKPSLLEFDARRGFQVEPPNSPQARYDVAVYLLSRLLGMDSVPPTVDRRWMQQDGNHVVSAQLWIHGTKPYLSPWGHTVNRWKFWQREPNPFVRELESTTDSTRRRELEEMFLLDYLAQIYDRHGGNVLVDRGNHLILIDNSHAFHPYPDMNAPEAGRVRMSAATRLRLSTLTREALENTLSPYLTPAEINGIWSRRNDLLAGRRW